MARSAALVTTRSATGRTVELTVDLVWLGLRSGFWTSVGVVNCAVLVIVPAVSALTTTVNVSLAPRRRVRVGKVRVLPFSVAPPVAETKVTPSGSVSVSVTAGVGDAPLFATVIVYVKLVVCGTGSGA